MDDPVGTVLAAAFPDREVDAVADPGPSWNDANRTVEVSFADDRSPGRVFLKVTLDGGGGRRERERAVTAYVRAAGTVPVPEVVAADPEADAPHLATAPVPGRLLHRVWHDADEERQRALAATVGDALARIHARRFETPGHVVGGDADGLRIDGAPWPDVLRDRIELFRSLADPVRFDHHFDAVAAAVERNRDLLTGVPAALLHGDPAMPNCFLPPDADSGASLGFLDWEIAHVGDPVREVRRAERQLFEPLFGEPDPRLVAAFREGYRERAGGFPAGHEDRRPVYDALTYLGVSGYLEEHATHREASREELATAMAAEMDRLLSRI